MASSPPAPRPVSGSVHPPMVADLRPKEKLKVPSLSTAKAYGALTDDSSYSEYAWEFLRRNRFYQAMVDKRSPAFDLAEWGYRPSPAHEVGFGLKHVKPYTQSHADAVPHWAPIAEWTDRMQHTIDHLKHHQPQIEYPGSQVAVVFDLAPAFGPGTVALQTQADLAVKYLEQLLAARANAQPAPPDDSKASTEPIYKPKPALLRGYLRLADMLSSPHTLPFKEHLPKAMQRNTPVMLTMEEAATQMPDYDVTDDKRENITDGQRLDRARRYADKAWRLIYGWECLNLLKFDAWVPTKPKEAAPEEQWG